MTTAAELRQEICKMAKEGDAWAKIIVADWNGNGLRLSANDVHRLAMDDAIYTCAVKEAERRLDGR